MKILLITANATIEKLFVLSADKKGDEVLVGTADNFPEGDYEAVFIDKDQYSDELFNDLKTNYNDAKFVLILSKNDEKLPGFDEYLTKPFLPTDLMEMLEKLPQMSVEHSHEDIKDDDLDIESFDDLKDLDLNDDLDDIGGLDDLDDDDLEFDLDDEIADIDLDESGIKNEETEEAEIEPLEEVENEELPEFEDETEMDEDLKDLDIHENEDDNIHKENENVQNDELEFDDEIEMDEDLKDLDTHEDVGEEDFEISEEELETEAPDDDIEESFEIDEDELINTDKEPEENEKNNEIQSDTQAVETGFDGLETEESNENEDILDNIAQENEQIPQESEIDISNEETGEKEDMQTENVNLEESTNGEMEDLNDIDEFELAKALGEDVGEIQPADSDVSQNIPEEDVIEEDFEPEKEEEFNIDEEIPSIEEVHELEKLTKEDSDKNIHEKTLGSILNINWDELKKAKAKVTITIDFGD